MQRSCVIYNSPASFEALALARLLLAKTVLRNLVTALPDPANLSVSSWRSEGLVSWTLWARSEPELTPWNGLVALDASTFPFPLETLSVCLGTGGLLETRNVVCFERGSKCTVLSLILVIPGAEQVKI